jgi:hypothetical protein
MISFKDWIKTKKCILQILNANKDCYGLIDPHHIKSRGSGGKDDSNILPLCRRHHSEIEQIGKKTFSKKYNLDLDFYCKLYWNRYNQEMLVRNSQQT